MPVPEEGKEGDPSKQNPDQYQPGTDPNRNPGQPTNPYQPGGPGNNVPAARKLALDLSGVAGFAILDDDGQEDAAPLAGQLGGSSLAPASGDADAFLRLESNVSGQVLTRTVNGVSRQQLQRTGLGVGRGIPELAQENPNGDAPAALPPSGDGAGPVPSGSTPPPEGVSEGSAGEQAGLLKIMNDGQIVPALVEVESDPAPTAPTGEQPPAEGGSGGAQPAPSPTSGAGGAGAGGAGAGGASSGGATSGVPPTGALPPGGTFGPRAEPLPRVTALGLSPDGSVYVLFEHGFFYRQPTTEEAAAPDFDPYSMQSPYRCQLFRADGSWREQAPADRALAELECVTNEYEVPTWDTRRVMQFDASGKLYFRAVTPANPQGVFLQFNPDTKVISEKVNANICWRDVQVTPRGSLFYTGSSGGTDGACGGGTSFFRYVSTDNRLTEIARDWWNFKYLAEQDPADPDNERIIFYGPDPNSTGAYSWDSACLYRYNPAIATPADRTQKLVECFRDGYSYVNGQNMGPNMPQTPTDEALPAFQARCESEGQLFIGGDGVSDISQLEDGTLFVVGRFQRKLAGALGCGLDVQGNHCALLGNGQQGDALDSVNTTKESCELANHVWVHLAIGCTDGVTQTQQDCQYPAFWNMSEGSRHYEMTGSACATVGDGITRNHLDCRAVGQANSFSQEVTGLGYLVPATESEPSHIELLSEPTERVERYWPVPGPDGAQLFYSTYSAGQYNLRMATQVAGEGDTVEIERRSLLDDYEVYNLQRDPANPSRVMFDALQFSTNSYLFGSIDPTLPTPEAVQDSVEIVAGVSGRLETLIILPDF
ncbi:MAG: hypothetical protein RL685_1984 [Pseudomonadota bacterium]|jgi:hypothetical protein